jgi:hypothetical protein
MVRTLAKAFVAVVALSLYGGSASAQVFEAHVGVSVPAPQISFDVEPPLVVVSPGVYVVEDYDQEVFFVDGWYWSRHGEVWYRTRDHRGSWVAAPPRFVPVKLAHVPPGRYRHFHAGAGHPRWREARGAEPRGHGARFEEHDRGRDRDHRGGGHGHGRGR